MLTTEIETPYARVSGAWPGMTSTAERQREPFAELNSIGVRVKVRRGREVFAEGDDPAFCYKILSGSARAVKLMSDGRRQVYEFLMPGDFFGLEDQGHHSFTVEAVTEVVLLKYPRRAVDRLLAQNPVFAREVQRITARGLHSAYQRMLLLTHKSAEERVAWFLLDMADRTHDPEGDLVHLPMTRTDIADYLGMVIETVSRALGRLKRARAIAMQSVNDIALVDRNRLEALRGEV